MEQVFFAMARDVKQRLTETVAAAAEVRIPVCVLVRLLYQFPIPWIGT